jgi:hypothetical protein
MDEIARWFQALPLITQIIALLVGLPIGLTILGGILIMMNDGAGPGTWGEKPSWGKYLVGTMVLGLYGALLLMAIFGSAYWLSRGLSAIGAGEWSYPIAFIISLLCVLSLFYLLFAAWATRRNT